MQIKLEITAIFDIYCPNDASEKNRILNHITEEEIPMILQGFYPYLHNTSPLFSFGKIEEVKTK